MDWFTLLLVFVFFILPLIQQVLEARKRGGQSPGLPGEDDEIDTAYLEAEEEALRQRTQQASGRPPVEAQGGWSAEWGGWPGTEPRQEEPRQEEPRAETVPVRPASSEAASARVPEPVGYHQSTLERVERQAPEPRPERVHVDRIERVVQERAAPKKMGDVDRAAEHRRFHERTELSAPASVIRAAHHSYLGVALRNRRELKRAILLAEVLGPPRALNPLEPK